MKDGHFLRQRRRRRVPRQLVVRLHDDAPEKVVSRVTQMIADQVARGCIVDTRYNSADRSTVYSVRPGFPKENYNL